MHEGRSWAIIQEHLNDTIGKQLVGLDEVHAALPHFLAEVDCPFNSAEWQAYYLDQFLEHAAKAQARQVLLSATQPEADPVTMFKVLCCPTSWRRWSAPSTQPSGRPTTWISSWSMLPRLRPDRCCSKDCSKDCLRLGSAAHDCLDAPWQWQTAPSTRPSGRPTTSTSSWSTPPRLGPDRYVAVTMLSTKLSPRLTSYHRTQAGS